MAIDETTSNVSLAPNVCIVPGVSAAVEEDEECVGEALSPVAGEESAAFAEVMAAVRDLEKRNISFGFRHLSEMCRRSSSCGTSPSC